MTADRIDGVGDDDSPVSRQNRGAWDYARDRSEPGLGVAPETTGRFEDPEHSPLGTGAHDEDRRAVVDDGVDVLGDESRWAARGGRRRRRSRRLSTTTRRSRTATNVEPSPESDACTRPQRAASPVSRSSRAWPVPQSDEKNRPSSLMLTCALKRYSAIVRYDAAIGVGAGAHGGPPGVMTTTGARANAA